MNKEDREILKLFQCEFNRQVEEDFATTLSERSDVRLFFINENQTFTDGKNIVVDPAHDNMFVDSVAMHNTENFLKLDHRISRDKYLALRMVTRAQNIHETLHIIYSDFPGGVINDKRGSTKIRKMVLAKIDNIIEDAFIEAAGASEFDNMAFYLLWGRVSRLFANAPSEGTIQRAFQAVHLKETELEQNKLILLMELLNYFITILLYPMVKISEPSCEIMEYIEKTKQLFIDGSICGNSKERYTYTQRIFDCLEPLIPGIEDEFDNQAFDELFVKLLGGCKTHSGESTSINEHKHHGKTAVITRRLFTDLDGNAIDFDDMNEYFLKVVDGFEADKHTAIKIVTSVGGFWEYTGNNFKCSAIHKGITIKVERPKPNLNLKKAYQNIYNKYKLNINSYNSRFSQLLKGLVDTKEDKFTFGSGIASKRLGDTKKRFWFRNVQGVDIPDIAILFLIDGSGSMEGIRRDCAMATSVILHEVLKKNNIEHAIVEHRAIYDEPLVRHNILIDFNYRDTEKYNILLLDADEGTREGLSLYWAEKYLNEQSDSENKVIIILSDGMPAHGLDGDACYVPPVSIKDTANAVVKIAKHGTNLIAVAIDDEGEDWCFKALKEMYPTVVACDDLKQLTGKLLTIVSKLFC